MNIQPLQVVQPVNNQGWVTCKNVGILALGVGGLALTYAATAYFGLNLRRSEKESLIETTGIEDYNLKNELLKGNLQRGYYVCLGSAVLLRKRFR